MSVKSCNHSTKGTSATSARNSNPSFTGLFSPVDITHCLYTAILYRGYGAAWQPVSYSNHCVSEGNWKQFPLIRSLLWYTVQVQQHVIIWLDKGKAQMLCLLLLLFGGGGGGKRERERMGGRGGWDDGGGGSFKQIECYGFFVLLLSVTFWYDWALTGKALHNIKQKLKTCFVIEYNLFSVKTDILSKTVFTKRFYNLWLW